MQTIRQNEPPKDADIRIPGSRGENTLAAAPDDVHGGYFPAAYHELIIRQPSQPTRARRDPGRGIPEDVFGGESRRRVLNTRAYPFSAVCALHLTAQTNHRFSGSGVLIRPNLVLTCGHNVFKHEFRGFMRSIRVYPGLNGDVNAPPFGSVSAGPSSLLTVDSWVQDAEEQFDFGAILLSTPLGREAGWLSSARLTGGTLSNLAIHSASYPRDCPRPDLPGMCGPAATTMWYDAVNVLSVEPNRLLYHLDTSEGSSGAPIYAHFRDKRDPYQVVAIHNYAHNSYNAGTRINDAVFSKILDWIKIADNL